MAWRERLEEANRELLEYLESGMRNRRGLMERFDVDNVDNVEIYLEAFKEWYEKENRFDFLHMYNSVPKYLPFPPPELTQEEIQKIADKIEAEIDNVRCIGVFISYLVNHDEIYPRKRIELKINKPLGYLGMYSEKEWFIEGDVGSDVGDHMKGGKMVINGNAGDWLGVAMKGGKIIVNGNAGDYVGAGIKGEIWIKGDAGDYVGQDMEGGKIHIEGNVGDDIARWMKDGEIYIKGNYEGLSRDIYGGNIYILRNGEWKQIVKDGKKI